MLLSRERVLVVEDDVLIGGDIMDAIEDAGGIALGPADSRRFAFQILEAEGVTAAILDVNVLDGEVTPIAASLIDRKVPFVVHTGGSVSARLRSHFGTAPILRKPIRSAALVESLAAAIIRARGEAPIVYAPGLGHALLIEDDPAMGLVLEGYAVAMGFTSVDRAGTEQDAVLAAKYRRPDLIIAEVTLSQGSGLAAVGLINATSDVPFVIVTATPRLATGVDETLVVAKPLSFDALKGAVLTANIRKGLQHRERIAGT